MADFCTRCNLDMFFGPNSDFDHFGLSGQITATEVAEGKGILVLCEGCGPTYVDHRGRCLGGCDLKHVPPDDDEVLRRVEAWQTRREGVFARVYRLWDWWNGTPWDPGYKHYLRHRWHTRFMKGDEFDFFDEPSVDQATQDGPIHGRGIAGDDVEGGRPLPDLRPGGNAE